MKSKIAIILSTFAIIFATIAAISVTTPNGVGSDAVTPIAGQTYTLAGAGISSTATEFDLVSFTIPQSGVKIQDSQMSETFYVTFEPGSRSRQEIASCTTVVQNSDNSATISGCTRGLSPLTPYTASTSLQFAHNGGTAVIFSNPPQLYNQAAFKDNDETITGNWSFPTPTGGLNAATKSYVDSIVNGGTVSYDQIIVSGQAGETVAAGNLIYFNGSDQEWYKVDSDDSSTFIDKYLGIAQGSGSDGAVVTGGILVSGLDQTQTGLTPGSTYYAAATAGTISTSVTSQPVGVAEDVDKLYFNPQLLLPTESANNTWTGTNSFSATTTFTGFVSGVASSTVRVYTSDGTWSKPSKLRYVKVQVQGAGGDGGAGSDGGGGGGSGAYSEELLTTTALSATSSVQVLVGTAGVGTGDTKFGTFLSAGNGADASTATGGAGGTASGGTININGQTGLNSEPNTNTGGAGGNCLFGHRGLAGQYTTDTTNAVNGQSATGYGCGGGGASAASDGSPTGTAGTGAPGIVIVTEYY